MQRPRPEDGGATAPGPDELPTFAARVCPYSRDTVAGCPFYEPVSAHGSAPDAARCRFVLAAHSSAHVRTLVCVRRTRDVTP